MFAIINIAGKQFKVEEGDQLKVPHLSTEVGKSLVFDKVLLINDNSNVELGSPILKNISVSATVVDHGRDRKIRIFKKKRRKGYQRKRGHRQDLTLLQIQSISAAKTKKTAAKKPAAKKTKSKK